jgi:hypothetical protein
MSATFINNIHNGKSEGEEARQTIIISSCKGYTHIHLFRFSAETNLKNVIFLRKLKVNLKVSSCTGEGGRMTLGRR